MGVEGLAALGTLRAELRRQRCRAREALALGLALASRAARAIAGRLVDRNRLRGANGVDVCHIGVGGRAAGCLVEGEKENQSIDVMVMATRAQRYLRLVRPYLRHWRHAVPASLVCGASIALVFVVEIELNYRFLGAAVLRANKSERFKVGRCERFSASIQCLFAIKTITGGGSWLASCFGANERVCAGERRTIISGAMTPLTSHPEQSNVSNKKLFLFSSFQWLTNNKRYTIVFLAYGVID